MRTPKEIFGFCGAALIALALAIGAAPAGGQSKDAPAAGSGLRLAVVDVQKVFEQSQEWQDRQEKHRRLLDATRRSLAKYDRQVRVLRSEYENLPPGTDAVVEKRAQLEAALKEYQVAQDELERQLRAQRTESLSQMWGKINSLLEQYARANGIDLVLKKRGVQPSGAETAELGLIMATTDVLYVSERFEITNEIIKELNAQYPAEIKSR
jgi:Skp family chaperone for outer membrane proteins